jgi:hypothetical protein
MAYIHPALRSKVFVQSAADINKAIIASQEPDPVKRDLRPLMALLTALPKAHPGVLADMQTRTNKGLGYEWTITATVPDGETSAPDVEILRASEIKRRLRESRLHNELRTLWNSRYYGVSLLETVWGTNARGENTIISLTPIEPVELKPWPAAGRGWARLMYASYDSDRYTLQPYDDPQTAIIAAYNPLRGIDNNHAGGLFMGILWYSYLQYVTWYHWARIGERMGVLSYGNQYNVDDVDAAYAFLQEVVDHAVKMPEALKITIRELLGDPPSADAFKGFIDKVDSMRQALILGQDVVNSSQETGSFAKSKEAGKTTDDYMWADIMDIQDVLTDQYVAVDYMLNYGEPTNGNLPRFTFITDEAEDHQANASVISQMASAGYEPEDLEEASRKVGYKLRKTEGTPFNLPIPE